MFLLETRAQRDCIRKENMWSQRWLCFFKMCFTSLFEKIDSEETDRGDKPRPSRLTTVHSEAIHEAVEANPSTSTCRLSLSSIFLRQQLFGTVTLLERFKDAAEARAFFRQTSQTAHRRTNEGKSQVSMRLNHFHIEHIVRTFCHPITISSSLWRIFFVDAVSASWTSSKTVAEKNKDWYNSGIEQLANSNHWLEWHLAWYLIASGYVWSFNKKREDFWFTLISRNRTLPVANHSLSERDETEHFQRYEDTQ